jgi:hypothetical protein
MRDLLFISHVTPEDNEQTIWLYSRLKLLGYNAWCDIKGLRGESDYWGYIQNRIQKEACKFLVIVTKRTFGRDGVLDEFEFAKSIGKANPELKDFILMLKFDDSSYNARIGQSRYHHIRFDESWAKGFSDLIEKLGKDNVPCSKQAESDAAQKWHSHLAIDRHRVIRGKRERYYSNWWPIAALPENLFIFHYANEKQADVIFQETQEYPVQRIGNMLVSFESHLPQVSTKNDNLEILPKEVLKITVKQILEGYESETFPRQQDAENLLKKLLNRCLHLMLKSKGLFWYELATKSNCYFFPKGIVERDRSTVIYHNRRKTKKLVGKFGSGFWHFAVSFRTRLRPIVCYSLQSHILFSHDGKQVWEAKDALHSARRRKGRYWFNEEWRDQLFAFLQALMKGDPIMAIDLNSEFTLEMHPFTATYFSDFGYVEPRSAERQDALVDDYDEIRFYEDIDSGETDEKQTDLD